MHCVAGCDVKSLHPYDVIFSVPVSLQSAIKYTIPFLGAFRQIAKKRLLGSSCLSARMEQFAPTGRVFFFREI